MKHHAFTTATLTAILAAFISTNANASCPAIAPGAHVSYAIPERAAPGALVYVLGSFFEQLPSNTVVVIGEDPDGPQAEFVVGPENKMLGDYGLFRVPENAPAITGPISLYAMRSCPSLSSPNAEFFERIDTAQYQQFEVVPDMPIYPSDQQLQIIDDTRAQLEWVDNSDKEDGFRIYVWDTSFHSYPMPMYFHSPGWVLYDVAGADVESFAINNLEPQTLYWFRVTAYNASGEADGGTLNIASAVTLSKAQGSGTVVATNSSISSTIKDGSHSATYVNAYEDADKDQLVARTGYDDVFYPRGMRTAAPGGSVAVQGRKFARIYDTANLIVEARFPGVGKVQFVAAHIRFYKDSQGAWQAEPVLLSAGDLHGFGYETDSDLMFDDKPELDMSASDIPNGIASGTISGTVKGYSHHGQSKITFAFQTQIEQH